MPLYFPVHGKIDRHEGGGLSTERERAERRECKTCAARLLLFFSRPPAFGANEHPDCCIRGTWFHGDIFCPCLRGEEKGCGMFFRVLNRLGKRTRFAHAWNDPPARLLRRLLYYLSETLQIESCFYSTRGHKRPNLRHSRLGRFHRGVFKIFALQDRHI